MAKTWGLFLVDFRVVDFRTFFVRFFMVSDWFRPFRTRFVRFGLNLDWRRYHFTEVSIQRRHYWKRNGPIFFYTGNEANVELYVNATGLMWENAQQFGAALVFAEHRYHLWKKKCKNQNENER